MSTFKRVERKRLPEVVASQIEEAIIDGTFGVGTQLPSEQQLAEEFGVSRNVVREAFKFLKERGLIEILNGSGAYICQPSSEATSNALGRYIRLIGAHSAIDSLYEARRTLEGANAQLAAQRANPHDLDTLAHCLTRMKDHAGRIDRWSEADLDFHLGIAQATHNPLMGALLTPLVDQLRGVIAEGYVVPGAVERGLEAHVKLYECIVNKDAEGAYAQMLNHLRDSEMRVLSVEKRQNAVAQKSP